MNILYYCVEYHRAFGPSTHAREFFSALQKTQGVDRCKVIPPAEEPDAVSSLQAHARRISWIRKLGKKLTPPWLLGLVLFFFPSRSILELFRRELGSGDWDVLVLRSGWALPLVPKLKREFPGVHILLEINSAVFDERFEEVPFRPFWRRQEGRLINSADSVTTVSGFLKKYLVRHGVEADKIYVNPNGVNLSLFNPARFSVEDKNSVRDELDIPRGSLLFGYVGGMQTFRKLPEMVTAFAEFLASGRSDAVLLLVGDGDDMKSVCQARDRFPDEIRRKIIIAGARPYGEIPKIMSAFDVAVFPFSNPYGCPQKLFEYMAMGLPVLGPKVPVVEETFCHGAQLLLADQEGTDDFKRLLFCCIEQPEALRKMALAGKEYVERNYTWEANAERVLSVIKSVSSGL